MVKEGETVNTATFQLFPQISLNGRTLQNEEILSYVQKKNHEKHPLEVRFHICPLVYISYVASDEHLASSFKRCLEIRNIKVLQSDRSQVLDTQSMKNIDDSCAILVIVSKEYIKECKNASSTVSKEVQYAPKKCIPVVFDKQFLRRVSWGNSFLAFHCGMTSIADLCDTIRNKESFESTESKLSKLCDRIRAK